MVICQQKKKSLVQSQDLEIKIFDDFELLQDTWDDCCPADDLYFSSHFFNVLKTQPPVGITNYFGLVILDQKQVGVILFQTKLFRLAESLVFDESKISGKIKHFFAKWINIRGVGIGNTLLTGKYGISLDSRLGDDLELEVIEKGRIAIREYLKRKGERTNIFVVKDFFDQNLPQGYEAKGYTKYTVQPNMIFNIDKSWSTFDEYHKAQTKKYRKRVSAARRKFEGLERFKMSVEDLEVYKEDMHRLYKNVVGNASFNLFELKLDYFLALKRNLSEDFTVVGYFKDKKLVGFSTLMHNVHHLDAHFLGYDFETNKNHQLYLNMLYDMVEYGIKYDFSSIVMSRTALEIKSSVGAKPYEMHLLIKYHYSLINWFLPTILGFFKPEKEWDERNPFGK